MMTEFLMDSFSVSHGAPVLVVAMINEVKLGCAEKQSLERELNGMCCLKIRSRCKQTQQNRQEAITTVCEAGSFQPSRPQIWVGRWLKRENTTELF